MSYVHSPFLIILLFWSNTSFSGNPVLGIGQLLHLCHHQVSLDWECGYMECSSLEGTGVANVFKWAVKHFPGDFHPIHPPSHSLRCRVWRIYSNIWIFKYFWSKYLFGYSFVSFFGYEYIRIFVRVNFLDTNIFGYSFVARFWYEYIRIFVRTHFQIPTMFFV